MGLLCLTLEEFLQPAAERVFYCGINYGPLLFCSRPFSSVVSERLIIARSLVQIQQGPPSQTAISLSGRADDAITGLLVRGRVPDGGPLSVFSVVSSAGQSNCLLSNRSLVRIQYSALYSFFQIPSGRALY